jgi:hypothetical protein
VIRASDGGELAREAYAATGDLPPASGRGTHGRRYGSGGAVVASFRRHRAGDRGLIAAPRDAASLCLSPTIFPITIENQFTYLVVIYIDSLWV